MKAFMQLLSLLICFEFILAPVQGSLLIQNAKAEEEKKCPVGQYLEPAVNRCLTKAEVLKVNEATKSCGQDKECYKTNASNALNDAGFKEEGKSGGIRVASAATIAVPLVIVTSVLLEKSKSQGVKDEKTGVAKSSFTCNPPSLLLMYGAAAALGVGEVYGYFSHKSKLKKIRDQWDATVVPKEESGTDKKRTEATEAQSQAFEFLAQNEEQVAKTAKTKRGFYLAATGLFAAGAIAATVELVQLNAAKAKLLTATQPAEIYALKKTINKLSCFTAEEGKGDSVKQGEDDKEIKMQSPEEIADAEKEASEAKLKEERAQAAKVSDDERKAAKKRALEDDIIAADPNSQEAKDIIRGRVNNAKTELNNINKPAPAPIPKKPAPVDGSLPGLDDAEDFGGNYIPKESFERLKKVAAYNVSTAKNAEQFVHLMKEFEAIEFHNYSTASYPEIDQSLKGITFTPEIAQMIAATLIPQARAQGLMAALPMAMPLLGGMKGILNVLKFNNGKPMSSADMQKIAGTSKNWVVKMIGKPVTRIAINGVLGGWMAIQQDHMKKQADLGTERAKKLRSMKEDFASANGIMNCTEADREDTSKPKCFCYTPENQINPSRSSTTVCKNAIATIKSAIADSTDKVCVNTSMAMDTACACRANNTCLKTTAGFSSMGFSPNTFKMISANSGAANDLFNGNASAGEIADSAGINAARTQAAAANAIAGDKVAVKEKNAAADSFEKGLIAATKGVSLGNSSGSSPLPSSPAAAAAALDKEIKDNNEDIAVTNSGSRTSGNGDFGNAVDEVPEFGLSTQDAAIQEIEIAEVMGKEVDFGSNDINKTKDTNLFEVLSNRYQRSGMKRLFEDGKSAPADAPAKTDISN